MKLYLVDAYKIYIYSLPNKVEDAFIINYVHPTGVEETITFIAKDNCWTIESTPEITYKKNNQVVETDILQHDSIYSIQFSDLTDYVDLYCFDARQIFYDYDVATLSQLYVGRTGTCNILYDNINVSSPEFCIRKQNGLWFLEDNGGYQTRVFVNNKRIRKTLLHFGDIIFTNGLKIIWLDSFIKVNNPNNKVTFSLSPRASQDSSDGENKFTPVKDTEKAIVLYNDNQVFFHTPRIKEDIVEKEIQIESPPQKFTDNEIPAILSVGTTAAMGASSAFTGFIAIYNVATGKATLSSASAEIVLCVTMVVSSVLFPILIERFNKKNNKRKEKLRLDTYREYLTSIRNEISAELSKEKKILFENYYDVEQLKSVIVSKSNMVWCREITDNDFLTIRLGIGNKKPALSISAGKKSFDLDKDVLNQELEELVATKLILDNVPITISLVKNTILPVVISADYQYRRQLINFWMLQLIGYYSGNDLKIVILTTENNSEQWDFIKYLPHCANEARNMRFYAESEDEAKQVSSYLEKIYDKRSGKVSRNSSSNEDDESDSLDELEEFDYREEAYKIFDTYYLIVTDNYVSAKKYGIIEKIVSHSINVGFSLVTIETTMQNVPSRCENIIQISNANAAIFNKSINENDEQKVFSPDLLYEDIRPYSNIIGNIPLAIESTAGKLPTSLSFLDMYKVGKIEQLNIFNRWAKNDPTLSISTPIGVHEDGKVFEIDLHEKFHGPHGLVAGSTGSGKSEFIITFILSMAINYHPYEVQFVLIDYKGGGLAGAFENKESGIKLPHLVGTITNLDVSEMNRTLVSINSELKRRQRMFNEARDLLNESTIDIYKYQKFYREGKVKEPISHLFIISDEFAELKSQQPEFMDALVSTARIGRSLGVHLILATQKPSGVVDDQIWSNSRFKVCLKVATAEDSRELLRRPEAAEIKEAGRFYLQVGFNELFELGQSGWAGAKYIPTDRIVKNIDDSIDIVDTLGTTIKRLNDSRVENQENHGEQLTNIVKFIYNIAVREKLEFKSMWLPSLPAELYISNLINMYNYKAQPYYIKPLVGIYDDPERQFQGEYSIDLSTEGSLLIYGLAGSGKENLITTILYSICVYHSSEEVNIYILDFGAEVLKIFKDMPQVGDVALIDEKDKIKSLILMLNREQTRRKELFSDFGGNYMDYIKNSGNKLPTIIVVLNGWDTMIETYVEYADLFGHLFRECSKYGIIFITTVVATNSMMTITQQIFSNKIMLQISDPFDYKFILGAKEGLIPKKEYSRGLTRIDENTYEFQAAYVYYKDKINDVIKATSESLSAVQKKAMPIPIIPQTVSADVFAPFITELSSVPVGYNIRNASVFSLNFINSKITPVIGNFIITEKSFLNDFLKTLNLLQDTKLKIIDFADILDDSSEFDDYSNSEFTSAINNIIENEQTETKHMIYVIIGIGRIYDKVLDEGIESLFSIFRNVDNYKKSNFIIIDNYSAFRKSMKEDWYNKVSKNVGIWVGPDVEGQTAISFSGMSKSDINEEFIGIIYATDGENKVVLKGLGARPEEVY